MNRSATRRTVGALTLIVVSALMALTACVLPPDPTAVAPVTEDDASAAEVMTESGLAIPGSWPAEVPLHEGGTLVLAEEDPSGTVQSVTWEVTQTPEAVAAEYDAALVAAGFVPGEPFSDETSVLSEYTGHGLSVTMYAALTGEGEGTQLAVTVQPPA